MKIMSSCVGEDTVVNWKTQMKAACDKCKGQDVTQTMVDIQAMLKEMRKQSSPFKKQASMSPPIYVPVPVYVNQPQPFFSPIQQPAFRTKRSSIDLSPKGIENLKETMMAKISNITCVLKELDLMDENNQPNYDHVVEEINKLSVDVDLKNDFLEAMDMCRDFAMCMPVEKAKHPIKKELGTTMLFMKCMQMKKILVCMQKDMKKYAPLMGFEGDVETEENGDLFDQITEMFYMEDSSLV
ncbi:uncharacterized protein LOC135217471 [Macrobrachium nipponense]|uniref:uncharacterized protein LOC135217471 n=1 Tax=Macrobrachium nipponense TaxID=159736 RepID=UPI0030C81F6C